jgi:hypothetical protein
MGIGPSRRFGDGFIFAGRIDSCVDAIGSVLGHLAAAGRSPDGFGWEYVGVNLTSVNDVRENFDIWRAAGGTHASVVSMGTNFDNTDAHIDYLGRALSAVRNGS